VALIVIPVAAALVGGFGLETGKAEQGQHRFLPGFGAQLRRR
jgi:hypothetical protein